MAYTPFLAGQKVTAGSLNLALLAGVCVFRAYRNAGQNIATGTESAANALSWDQVDVDVLSGWNSGTPTLWTVPQSGKYTLAGTVAYNGSAAGTVRDACWFVNGAIVASGRGREAGAGFPAGAVIVVAARTLPQILTAGDTVALVPAHDTGGALSTATGTNRAFISITYSGP